MSIQFSRPTARQLLAPTLLLILLASGCGGISEAIIDGFFAGISDTVAGVVTDALQTGSGG